MSLRLILNGEPKRFEARSDTFLADLLREQAGLTGTKVCCEAGHCGACTVHIDGVPRVSCLTLAREVDGQQVDTVEGLATGDDLHPVQQAFVRHDALQCGFCTPGMLMASVAFYDAWLADHPEPDRPKPSREQVMFALAGNLCRCGAQPHIIDALRDACVDDSTAEAGASTPASQPPDKQKPPHRADAVAKVTGRADYTIDHLPDRCVHGVVVRSPHAHARVLAIDLEPARECPGVVAAELLLEIENDPMVRWVGQPVACVAAESLTEARAAAEAVAAQYEVLPATLDYTEALAPGAPTVWAADARGWGWHKSAGTMPFLPTDDVPWAGRADLIPELLYRWRDNVRGPLRWPLNGVSSCFARRAYEGGSERVDLRCETATQMHVPLERHCCVAQWQGDHLSMHASNQSLVALRGSLAQHFDLPKDNVQVNASYVGGAFGCKSDLQTENLAAAVLAKSCQRPVKIVFTLAEHLSVGGNRPGTRQRLRLSTDRDGRVAGILHQAASLTGAAIGTDCTALSKLHYKYTSSHYQDTDALTHTPPGAMFRGPGFPPNAFSLEQAIDQLAIDTGRDPLEFRLAQETSSRYRKVLEWTSDLLAKERITLGPAPSNDARYLRGFGLATASFEVIVSPTCVVAVEADPSGQVTLRSAATDLGQGSRTVLLSLACKMLQVPEQRVTVVVGDSELPRAPGQFASVTTPSIAPAASQALAKLQTVLQQAACRELPGATPAPGGVFYDDRLIPFADLFAYLDQPVSTKAERGPDRVAFKLPPAPLNFLWHWMDYVFSRAVASSVQVVEVEVDRLLGTVRVPKVLTVVDGGTIINPTTATSQCVGGVIQGVSYALYEQRKIDLWTGQTLSTSFDAYSILGIAETPQIDVRFFPEPAPDVPDGCLGIAEIGTIPTAAAVANAVRAATGTRFLATPIAPADVLSALKTEAPTLAQASAAESKV